MLGGCFPQPIQRTTRRCCSEAFHVTGTCKIGFCPPSFCFVCSRARVCMRCFHFFKYWIIKQRTVETSAQGAGMMTETLVVRITENVYMTIATWLLRMFPEIPNKTSLSFSNYDFYFVKILFSVFCLLQLSC